MLPAAPPYSHAGRRAAEVVQLWLLPTAGLAGAALWWRALGVRGTVLLVVLAYPALVSTLVVALGAGVWRLWRFPLPYAVRGVPPHIGLIYAGTLNLALAAAATVVGAEVFTESLVLAVGLGALAGAAAGVAYDVSATHFGLLEPPARVHGRRPLGAWAVVRRYGFQFFGGMGALTSAALWAAAQTLPLGASAGTLAAGLVGAALLGAAPFALVLWRFARRLRRAGRLAS